MPSSDPRDLPAAQDELSFDEADTFGFDATGRDGDPRFPYTVAHLTAAQRQRLAELRAAAPGRVATPAPVLDDPGHQALSTRAAAQLAAGLAEYATGNRVLDAPELQVLYRYAPINGPACFELSLIHESVWRRWPDADALPERVDLHTFLGLLANLPDSRPWAQPEAHFTVVGFSLCYDAPAEPGPAPSADYAVRDEPARVTVAVDADHRRYRHVHQAGAAAGHVVVWKLTTVGPVDTPNVVTRGDSTALYRLHRLVDRLRMPADPPADTAGGDEDVLVPGEIVAVTGDQFDDDDRARLWVVVDYVDDYAIAVLGGDGYQWRRIPRADLVRVAAQWIRRTIRIRHDQTFAYVGADTTAPVLIEDTFHRDLPGRYELTRVYRLAGHVLRVRVRRDVTPDASVAQAQLLNPPDGYTVLVETPARDWHSATPPSTGDAAPLLPIATQLLHRAARILTPPEPTGT